MLIRMNNQSKYLMKLILIKDKNFLILDVGFDVEK